MIYINGSSNKEGNGVGIVHLGLKGQEIKYTLRLSFPTTNNVVGYETFIISLKLAWKVGPRNVKVYSDSQLIVE